MTHTNYFAMEFHGAGDPYFGGTAADWALYNTGDGGQAFISAADAQRRKLAFAYFPNAAEAEQAGTVASTRKGADFRPSRETPVRSPDRTDFLDCRQQTCRRGR